MTRKDYELIAAAYNDVRPVRSSFNTTRAYEIAFAIWDQCRQHLANKLQSTNPAFNRDQFILATEGRA